jgi:hypothetical protein
MFAAMRRAPSWVSSLAAAGAPLPAAADRRGKRILLHREGSRRLAYVYFEEEPGRRAAAKAAHSRRGAAGCGEHSPSSRC